MTPAHGREFSCCCEFAQGVKKFLHSGRLGEIGIAPCELGAKAIHCAGAGGQHDQHGRTLCPESAQLAAAPRAPHARHFEVNQCDIVGFVGSLAQARFAAVSGINRKADFDQRSRNCLAGKCESSITSTFSALPWRRRWR